MNVDNENIEPETDLGLALGYSNQCIQRGLNNDSGAGANAGSGINMTFVANNPLSELVWSPHKGPSNVALLPSQSIIGRNTTTQISMDGENASISNTLLQMKSEVAGKDTLSRSPRSDAGGMPVCGPSHEYETGNGGDAEEINTAAELTALYIDQKGVQGESKGDDISGCVESQIAKISETKGNQFSTSPGQLNIKRTDVFSIIADQPEPDEAQIEASPRDPVGRNRNVDSSNHTLQIDFTLTSEAHCANDTEALGDPVANRIFHRGKCYQTTESTSENDLQNLKSENVCGAAAEIVALESSPEVKGCCQWSEELAPTNKTHLDQNSPTNMRVQVNRRKGKEKALSDGDLNAVMSKDEDGSHESVESRNSAGLFSQGKRRRSFEEDLVVGSKGFKKQIHGTQGSMSFTRQGSSFMNWISNMMKGFSKSVQDKAPFPLNTTHQDDGHENPDKKLISLNKNQDPGSKIIGFQSIFQSLYCKKPEVQETRMFNVNYQIGEGSKEYEWSNKMHDINATPIACRGEDSNLSRQFLLLNERFNESTSGNEEDSAIQPKMLLEKLSGSQEKVDNNSEENNNKSHLAYPSSNSSLGKRKTYTAEKADSVDPPSTVKTTSKFCHRNDPLGSFWVTRFAPKSLSSSSNMDHLNQSAGASPKCSTECLKLVPRAQNHYGFHVDSKFLEAKDQSSEETVLVSNKELENISSKIKSHNDQKPMYDLDPIFPSLNLKPSDTMASVFARRLDALKHVTSSRGTRNSAHATMTCFFCGINGHHLRHCSEITELEREELMRNVNTYRGVEETSCVCIRCFQHNHWAIACPKVSSTKHLQMESNASLSDILVDSGSKENLKLQTGKDTQLQAAVAHTYCTSPVKRQFASSSGENVLKENQIIPFSHIVSKQNLDVPKGLFDAVKRLRLSRTDILKWMNSHMSLARIDGFFLRLRLGKWEEGLGGTGYHVACIVGTQRDNQLQQDGKSSILVDVGGFRCLVESQYISNHNFLEDELMAWWSTTSRNGGKIPSEEDLESKLKTKRMLGF